MNLVGSHLKFALLSARHLSGPSERGANDFIRLASRAYDEGHLDLAERCIRRARDLWPATAEPYTWLGSLQYERGKVAEARNSFEQALKLDPASGDAQLGMAASLHAMGMPSDAIYHYLSYLQDNPKSVDAMIYLADAFESTGQMEEAIEIIERACDLEPESPEVLGHHGRMLFELGRIDEGTTSLRKALELRPMDSGLHLNLGVALQAQGNLEEARAKFERALAIDPRNLDAYIQLSSLLTEEAHQVKEGLEYAQKAVEIAKDLGRLDEERAQALWQLGWAYYMVGAWRESAEASRDALANDPRLLPVRFNLGLALLRDGEVEQARTEYAKAAESVDDVWDLRVDGIEDLKAALTDNPDMSGGAEILELLEEKYRQLSTRRSSSLPS